MWTLKFVKLKLKEKTEKLTNLFMFFLKHGLTKLYLKDMLERNSGKILQLASSVSKAPSPYLSVYAATKAFVLSLTEALQKEIENSDVTITALQPGATDTDFFHKAKAENTVTYKDTSLYDPKDVAKRQPRR